MQGSRDVEQDRSRLSKLWAASLASLLISGCGNSPPPAASQTETETSSDAGSSEGSVTGEDRPQTGGDGTTGFPMPGCEGAALPVLHEADPALASRGEELVRSGLGAPLFPRLALENLWIVWGSGPPADYWAAFRERYGLAEASWDNDGYPAGIHATSSSMATLDCLFCHTDVVAGRTLMGAGNSRVDFQGFYDDLVALNELAPDFGFPPVELPWVIEDRTGAAGATDAYGLGMEFSLAVGPKGAPIATEYGYQQPAAWWTVRYKDRVYSDGSGDAQAHRTMAAMTLAFGGSFADRDQLDADMLDIHHYMRSLDPPDWELTPINQEAAARGAEVFTQDCARCHGAPCGVDGPGYTSAVIPLAEVGTDPRRAEAFTAAEAAWINASWYGEEHPVEDTDGYVVPALVGVWATAPYFHNGSVPDLLGVLDSSRRPIRWRRTGSEEADYDPETVGWRYETVDAAVGQADITARKVYDTSVPGLGNGGHTFGDGLTSEQRADLIEYLKTR